MRIAVSFIFVLLFSTLSLSQNPFFTPVQSDSSDTIEKRKESVSKTSEKKVIQNSLFNDFIKKNARLQRKVKDELAALANSYKKEGNYSSIIIILLLAFLYGVLHSFGPGHGKVFVFAYILTEKPKILKAIGTSYGIAIVHGLSGLIVSLIIVFTLSTYASSAGEIEESSKIISQLSFIIIMALGIYLFLKNIFNKGHHHHDEPKKKKLIPFLLSVGLVPCPATIITVTFLSSIGMLAVGIISTIFIVLGMGTTIALIGVLSIFSKALVQKLYSGKDDKIEAIFRVISIIGALLLILFGAFFLLGTF